MCNFTPQNKLGEDQNKQREDQNKQREDQNKQREDKERYPVEDVLYNFKPEFNNLEELGLRSFNSKMWSDKSADKLRGGLKLTVGF